MGKFFVNGSEVESFSIDYILAGHDGEDIDTIEHTDYVFDEVSVHVIGSSIDVECKNEGKLVHSHKLNPHVVLELKVWYKGGKA